MKFAGAGSEHVRTRGHSLVLWGISVPPCSRPEQEEWHGIEAVHTFASQRELMLSYGGRAVELGSVIRVGLEPNLGELGCGDQSRATAGACNVVGTRAMSYWAHN